MTDQGLAKILIVDDARTMCTMLRSLFRSEGYDVVGVYESGRGLLDAVGRLQPDIICLDYNLPGVDGLELLKKIHGAYPSIAVVMITGNESPDLEEAAVEAGSSGFIRKPFTQNDIVRDIRQVMIAQQLLSRAIQAEESQAEKASRARVVIADDSSTMRKLLAAILSQSDIEIVGEASDGRQAVELATAYHPDFICLDIEMPVMNGMDALVEIHSKLPEIKVLMVTASSDREYVMQAVKKGAKGYITKPYQPNKIIEAVNKLLD